MVDTMMRLEGAKLQRTQRFRILRWLIIQDMTFLAGWLLLQYGLGQIINHVHLDFFDSFLIWCMRIVMGIPPTYVLASTVWHDVVQFTLVVHPNTMRASAVTLFGGLFGVGVWALAILAATRLLYPFSVQLAPLAREILRHKWQASTKKARGARSRKRGGPRRFR
jgi:hypothetical protein